jgi:hypothetical protein
MKLNCMADGTILYKCPCGDTHAINRRTWQVTGDVERPTFAPSVLVTTGHFIPEQRNDGSCWCTYNAENPNDPIPFGCYRCHSFVKNGMVEFLGDCTHPLAGKTVPLGDWT